MCHSRSSSHGCDDVAPPLEGVLSALNVCRKHGVLFHFRSLGIGTQREMDDEHSEEASSERNEQPSQYSKQSFHTLNRHRRSHDWRNQAITRFEPQSA
jgi:hypothetical protein